MSEVTKNKKLRLYKYAAEFNLSTDTLMNFLIEKGYQIKGHMSILSDEMLIDINKRFKKDIENAEKHYKKVDAFKKKHSNVTEEKRPSDNIPDSIPNNYNEEEVVKTDEVIIEEKEILDTTVSEKETEVFSENDQKNIEDSVDIEYIADTPPDLIETDVKEVSEIKDEKSTVEIIEEKPEVAELELESTEIESNLKLNESKIEDKPENEASDTENNKDDNTTTEFPIKDEIVIPEEDVIDKGIEENLSYKNEQLNNDITNEIEEPMEIELEIINSEVVEKEETELEDDNEDFTDGSEPDGDENEDGIFKTRTELELEKNKLKVLGKIDLNKPEKKEEKKIFKRRKDRPERKDGRLTEPRLKLRKRKEIEEEEKIRKEKERIEREKARERIESLTKKDPDDKTSTDGVSTDDKPKKKVLKAKKKVKGKEDEVFDDAASKKKRKKVKSEVDDTEVQAAIKRTILSMDDKPDFDRAKERKKKKQVRQAERDEIEELKELDKNKIQVTEFISVNELANLMDVPVTQVIAKCMGLGLMVSINQRLDFETLTLVADEFGFEIEKQEEFSADLVEDLSDDSDDTIPRHPVVTIMGHVDHGKTSLLDYIRNANVVAGESGGITQHIGAYQVDLDEQRSITFLDTPGHEAFTAMRARGAKVTDIVVLVVAADDAVMPQTIEAINHSKAAGVPIVIAINKMDKPGVNPDKIKQQLADRNILVEDWGGKYQSVELSAKTGKNVDELLEKILLEADVLELKSNPDRLAIGTIVETKLDKGKGITATVLVQKGTLRVGDPFVSGVFHGRVRALLDERGNKLEKAGPAAPAVVLGFEGAPQAGDTFVVVKSEREAREIAIKRQQVKREQDMRQVKLMTLDEIASQIGTGGIRELGLVVKGDVDGSVEALSDSFMKLSNNEVKVNVIHRGVGAISEGDVLLAAASRAIIVGFHVRPHTNARKIAEQEKVDIRLYNVIYDAIAEVKSALEGMLAPVVSEKMVSTIEVRDTFKVPKLGTVAGCYVTEGKVSRDQKIRLFRDGVVIYEGELASLRRFKDDVKEVAAGYECGLNINNFNDIKVGDIIESYEIIHTKKKLE